MSGLCSQLGNGAMLQVRAPGARGGGSGLVMSAGWKHVFCKNTF